MIKDRAQKASVLRLCVSKRWLPQLEIEVEPHGRTERTKAVLTDVDVLALIPQQLTGYQRVVFDCKSGVKESAIGRAFWLKGVMERVHASHGFVMLNDKIVLHRDHRINAADIDVSLINDRDFEPFAKAMGATATKTRGATDSIDAWDALFQLRSEVPQVRPYLDYSRAGYWMARDAGEQFRRTIAKLRQVKNELDPVKPAHLAIFGDALCLVLLALSEVTFRIFLAFLQPIAKDDFSQALLALLYGGYDNLETALRIKGLTTTAVAEDNASVFPELSRLEQLAREMIVAPQEALQSALIAREISLATLGGAPTTSLGLELAKSSPYAAKYCLLGADYLCRAAKLPSEFGAIFRTTILYLMSPTSDAAPGARPSKTEMNVDN